ncbi:NIPSNAP-domain-containing protein [Patellaria atrata CBS 101060]|uniref:NIPSNAP-domain-containing protein n=1 Tax=Patellaria atrata CBS 101060 TaxID=1346257 RepID=A0A9P4SAQ8_9PEZI|nr:NIPSNAP-domain-containing protein [Patellaria atrata CBS 101060]
MLTRRIAPSLRSVVPPSSITRSFSAVTAQYADKKLSTPSLADITHDGAADFNARQREFREQLAAQQRQREQAENEAREREAQQEGGKKKTGPLSSLIYGTTEGRNLDKDIERSFSQVLARGKYVHSIVFHEVKPDKVDEYVQLVGNWYPRMASMPEHKVHLVGSWRTEVGECDTFVHIWEYQRYEGYHASLNAFENHPDYAEFNKKLRSYIFSKRSSLMQEFSFWPTTPPRKLGGLFELRSYTLHPGNLLEWETHWRRGLGARKQVMEGVGAWFVQIGELNTVHHMWQFADLEERKVRREQSWSVEGWGETVHKTVPLIQTMKSKILIPCPWSPVA